MHPHRIPRLEPLPANRTLVIEVVSVHQTVPPQVPLTCESLTASIALQVDRSAVRPLNMIGHVIHHPPAEDAHHLLTGVHLVPVPPVIALGIELQVALEAGVPVFEYLFSVVVQESVGGQHLLIGEGFVALGTLVGEFFSVGAPHVPFDGVAAEFLPAYPTLNPLDEVFLLPVGHELSEIGEGDPTDLADPRLLWMLRLAVLVIFRHIRKHGEALVAVPCSTDRPLLVCCSVAFHLILGHFFKTISAIYQSFILKILQICLLVKVETRMLLRFSQDTPIRLLAESTSRVFRRTIVRLGIELATVVAKESFVYVTRMFLQFIQGIKACAAYLALKVGNHDLLINFASYFRTVLGGFLQEVVREKGAFRRRRETGAPFFATVAIVEAEDVFVQTILLGETH